MAKLVLNGGISEWGVSANYVRYELGKMSGDIDVEISSFGGSFYEGMGIFNLLRQYSKEKGKVTTIITDKAMSAGSHIFLAGDVRKAYSNATIMCHCAWNVVGGDTHDMARQAKILDGIDNVQANLYKRFQDRSLEEIKSDMRNEMWYIGSEQLLESGFVDEIIEVDELPESQSNVLAKYDDFKAQYKVEYATHAKDLSLDDVEQEIKTCMGDCPLATVPSTEKTAISTQGQSMPKEADVHSPSIDVNEVDGGQLTLEEVVAQARAEEAMRIQNVEGIIPKAHKDNAEVKAKLYDPNTSVNDMKAFLFDIDAKIAEDARSAAQTEAEKADDLMAEIDSASTVVSDVSDDATGAAMSAVTKIFGGK